MYMNEGGIQRQSLREDNRPAAGPQIILVSGHRSTSNDLKEKQSDNAGSESHKENKLCPYQRTYLLWGILIDDKAELLHGNK